MKNVKMIRCKRCGWTGSVKEILFGDTNLFKCPACLNEACFDSIAIEEGEEYQRGGYITLDRVATGRIDWGEAVRRMAEEMRRNGRRRDRIWID